MTGRLEDLFQIGGGLPAEAFCAPDDRLETIRGELANMSENERLSIGGAKTPSCLLRETERLSDISQNLATPTGQIRTELLRFYLGGLAASGADHVCALIKTLEADLTSEARDPSKGGYSIRW
jgi:hypothetical protein